MQRRGQSGKSGRTGGGRRNNGNYTGGSGSRNSTSSSGGGGRGGGARGRGAAKSLADTYLKQQNAGGGSAAAAAHVQMAAQRTRMIENELNLENVHQPGASGGGGGGGGGGNGGAPPRSGEQLWNVVKKKPVTLSQKLRALENAIKVLQQRCADHDLPTDVDGEDPVPPSEEIKKLKNKLAETTEQASMAEQHKRAAAEYEKQARDAKALLEKLRSAGTLKAKELELSAQAGALARKNLADSKMQMAAKAAELADEKGARAEAERNLAEARHGLELLRKQLEELHAQSNAMLASRAELEDQVKRQGEQVARLEDEKGDLLKQIETMKDTKGNGGEQLKALEAQIDANKEEHTRLQIRLAEQDAKLLRLQELERTLAEAIKEHETTMATLQQKTSECKTLSESLDTVQKKSAAKDETIATLTNENAVAQNDVAAQKKMYAAEYTRAQGLQQELDDLKRAQERNTSADTGALRTARAEFDAANKALTEATKTQQDTETLLVTSQAKNKSLEAALESMENKMAKLEQQLTESRNLETSARVQNNAQSRAKLEAAARAQVALVAAQNAAEALEEARKKLAEAVAKNAELQSQCTAQHGQLEAFNTTVAGLKDDLHGLREQHAKDLEACDALKEELQNAFLERDELKAALGSSSTGVTSDEAVVVRLKSLNTSLQKQLNEANAAHRHIANQLEKESLNSALAVQAKETERRKSEKLVKDLRKHLARDREKSSLMARDMQTLENTIETLTNQLSSLVESGESFETNAQRREENLMGQIKRLRHGREKDREAYATAVDASNVWKTRAENAELKLASMLLKKHNVGKKNRNTGGKIVGRGGGGGGGGGPNDDDGINSYRTTKQPRPPRGRRRTGDYDRINKNEVLSKRNRRDASSSEQRQQQAAYAERMMEKLGVKTPKWKNDEDLTHAPPAGAKNRLPPVGGASPAPTRRSSGPSAIQPSVANLDHALANMLETPA